MGALARRTGSRATQSGVACSNDDHLFPIGDSGCAAGNCSESPPAPMAT